MLADLIPGSPAYAIYGQVPRSFADRWNRQHGLDRPIYVQYWTWLRHAVHGSLGTSWQSSGAQSVVSLLAGHLPVTAEIAVSAIVLSLVVAVPVAMVAAARPASRIDRLIIFVASMLDSAAVFVIALFLVAILAVRLGVLPSQGWVSVGKDLGGNVRDALLPVITLVLALAPNFVRVLRGDLVSKLNEDFVAAARSRGMPEWYVMFRHVLRPASVSLLTVASLSFGYLLAGSVVVETFFNLPGVGALALYSVQYKDIPVLQGIVVCVAVIFIVVNTFVDFAYGIIDPRVRIN